MCVDGVTSSQQIGRQGHKTVPSNSFYALFLFFFVWYHQSSLCSVQKPANLCQNQHLLPGHILKVFLVSSRFFCYRECSNRYDNTRNDEKTLSHFISFRLKKDLFKSMQSILRYSKSNKQLFLNCSQMIDKLLSQLFD